MRIIAGIIYSILITTALFYRSMYEKERDSNRQLRRERDELKCDKLRNKAMTISLIDIVDKFEKSDNALALGGNAFQAMRDVTRIVRNAENKIELDSNQTN